MATNGLSTTYGDLLGEGWLKFDVPNTSGTTAKVLPAGYNEECVIEFIIKMGTGYSLQSVYNPGGTTDAGFALLPAPGTAGADIGVMKPVKSDGTLNTTHVINLVKDATTGALSVRQNTSASRNAATIWCRRIG